MLRSSPALLAVLLASLAVASILRPDPGEEDRKIFDAGRELIASGEFLKGAEVLEKIAGDPRVSSLALEARLLRAHALIRAGSHREGGEAARAVYEALPVEAAGRGRALAIVAEAHERAGEMDAAARLYGEEAGRVLGDGHRSRVAAYYLTLAAEAEKAGERADPLKPPAPPRPELAAELQRKALEILTGGKPLARVTLPRVRNLIAAAENAGPPQRRQDPRRGFYSSASAELKALLDEAKDLAARDAAEARMLRAKALSGLGEHGEAVREIETLFRMPSADEFPAAAEARVLLGHALVALGGDRVPRGVAAWREFLAKHPSHGRASEVRAAIAGSLDSRGDLDEAMAAYGELARDGSASAQVRARAQFLAGTCLMRLERFDAARQAFQRYLAEYPDHEQVPEAQRLVPELLLLKSAALRKRQDLDGAVVALREYLVEYPLSDRAASVAREVGIVLREKKDWEGALSALRGARDRYQNHNAEEAAQSGLLLAAVEEEDKADLEAAAASLQEVVKRFPSTRAGVEAARRLANLSAVELELSTPRLFAPGEKAYVELVTRNVKDATFRLYRLDARAFFERRGTLDGVADIEVALVKSDRTFPFSPGNWMRYRRDRSRVELEMKEGEALPEGSYLVAVEVGERRAVVPVFVSSVRLVVKQSPRELFLWATESGSGEPLEGVEILVRGPEIATALKTGKDGVARLLHERDVESCQVIALAGGGVAPGMPRPAIAPGAVALAPRAAFTLDRPLYAPGSEVRFRAVIRDVHGGELVTPAKGGKVEARLKDPSGRTLGFIEIATTDFGVVHGSFMVPGNGAVGEHTLELVHGEDVFTEPVAVRSYTKPEFQVRVLPGGAPVTPGDDAEVETEVAYFFGGPVKNAEFEWQAFSSPYTVDTSRYSSHAWFLRAAARAAGEEWTPGQEFVASGAGHLDERGRAKFRIPTKMTDGTDQYLVLVRVRDTAGAYVSGSGTFYAGATDRFAVVLSKSRTLRAGDHLDVRIVTAGPGHEPVATRGELHALLRRTGPDGRPGLDPVATAAVDTGLAGEATVRIKLDVAGDYLLRFTGKDGRGRPVVATTVAVATGERPDLAKEALLRFEREAYGAGEEARMHLSVPEAKRPVLLTFEGERVIDHRILRPDEKHGVHVVRFEDRHAPNIVVGMAMSHDHRLLTSEDAVVVMRYLEVDVSPEASAAAPGSEVGVGITLKDQAGRPVKGSVALRAVDGALASLGGRAAEDPRFVFNRDVRPHWVATGSSFSFAFQGATRMLDRDLLHLKTEEIRQEMARKVAADSAPAPRPSAAPADLRGGGGFAGRPGAEERRMDAPGVARRARAESNRNQSPAEMGASRDAEMEEELKELDAADGVFFFGRGGGALGERSKLADDRENSDKTRDAYLLHTLTVEKSPELLNKYKKSLDDTMRREVASGFLFTETPLIEGALREQLLDVAGWWPDLVTDDEGKARVSLKLPDNLTKWDLSASGITRATHAGSGSAGILAGRDFLVSLDRPGFLTSADRAAVSVQARSAVDATVAARMNFGTGAEGVVAAEGMAEHTFRLAPFGRERRTYWLEAKRAGAATIESSLATDAGGDRLRVGLPVIAFGEPWTHAERRELIDELDFPVSIEGPVVAGSENYQVVVEAGAAAEILEGLNFLMGYPYGCLEQVLNRFYPALLLSGALESAGRPAPVRREILSALVESGILQMQGYQGADGTFGYWPGKGGHPWVTAMALEALQAARAAGFRVDGQLMEGAVNGARRLLDDASTELDARMALHLALLRAGVRDPAAFSRLLRERDSLSTGSLARLLLAARAGGWVDQIPSLFAALQDRRRKGDGPPFAGRLRHPWQGEDHEATALALLAYQAAGASAAEMEPLVAAVRRGLGRRIGSTRGVALAIEALAAHVAGEGARPYAGRIQVFVGKEAVASGNVSGDVPVLSLPVPAASLPPGSHRVRVVKEGGAGVTCRLVLRHVRVAAETHAAGNVLAVQRRIIDYLDPNREETEYAPGYSIVKPGHRPKPLEPESRTHAVAGGKVTVELRVRARETVHHLVIRDPQIAGLDAIDNGVRGGHDRFERRAAQLLFFKDRLDQNEELVVTYPCYAVFEGSYAALAAEAEEMYAPERRGRSGSMRFTIVPDPSHLAARPVRAPTPDELYHRGLKAFEDREWAESIRLLSPLPAEWQLLDEHHDIVLARLLVARLRSELWSDAVRTREALRLRNPGMDRLDVADRERLGRAYLAVKDAAAAREQLRSVLFHAFRQEMEISSTLLDVGQPLAALAQTEEAMLRYPLAGDVAAVHGALPGRWLEARIEDLPEAEARMLPEIRRVHYREALDRFLSVMAWQRGYAMAEDAAFRRMGAIAALDQRELLVEEARKYLRRYPGSRRRDQAVSQLASALFALGRFEEAAEEARKLWDGLWPVLVNGRETERPSPLRPQAGFLLGRIAHVKGAYGEATEWYGRVKDDIPDARQSYLFFTSRELEVDPLTRADPAREVSVSYQGKNLKELQVQIYPVDLSVLFAVKKSFEAMTTADLAGVLPSREFAVKTGMQPYTRGGGAVSLGSMKPGAYLVVLREGDGTASTLLLVTGAGLTLQRSDGAVRMYLTDAAGRPVPDAAVKCGTGGRIFHSGRTDERGLLDVADPGGVLTVVAEKNDVVAVATAR